MAKKVETVNQKQFEEDIKSGRIVKEVKEEIKTQKIENNLEAIITQADEVVAKHKLIIDLVSQCLIKHKKQHDETLALKLYKHFDNELK